MTCSKISAVEFSPSALASPVQNAAAPIVTAESIDFDRAFMQSRYDRGEPDDYINCPLNKEEYEIFYDALINAQSAETHEFDKRKDVYEGCMPAS